MEHEDEGEVDAKPLGVGTFSKVVVTGYHAKLWCSLYGLSIRAVIFFVAGFDSTIILARTRTTIVIRQLFHRKVINSDSS